MGCARRTMQDHAGALLRGPLATAVLRSVQCVHTRGGLLCCGGGIWRVLTFSVLYAVARAGRVHCSPCGAVFSSPHSTEEDVVPVCFVLTLFLLCHDWGRYPCRGRKEVENQLRILFRTLN